MCRLLPFTLFIETEPLKVFNYLFKARQRNLIDAVIFNSPPFSIVMALYISSYQKSIVDLGGVYGNL